MLNAHPETGSINPVYCLVGNGGHARVVLSIALALGLRVEGVISPEGSAETGLPHLGTDNTYMKWRTAGPDRRFLFGVGSVDVASMQRRAEIFEVFWSMGGTAPALVHPTANVADTAQLGPGTVICRAAVVGEHVRIGRNVIVNTAAVIDHDTVIGDHSHVCPGVVASGGVIIGARVHVGVGARLIQCVSIGDDALVGAGTVVLHSVGERQVVAGSRARIISAPET